MRATTTSPATDVPPSEEFDLPRMEAPPPPPPPGRVGRLPFSEDEQTRFYALWLAVLNRQTANPHLVPGAPEAVRDAKVFLAWIEEGTMP